MLIFTYISLKPIILCLQVSCSKYFEQVHYVLVIYLRRNFNNDWANKIVNVLLEEIFEVLNFSAISRYFLYFLVSSVFENVFQTIFLARIISYLAAILYVSII